MKRIITSVLATALLGATATWADEDEDRGKGQRYEVTITNATRGQVITPPVIVSHGRHFNLFQIGQPASSELAYLAEEGDPAPLVSALEMDHRVRTIAVGTGPILPGQSQTIMITVPNKHLRLSAAAMLAVSNDAFMAVRGARVPRHGQARIMAHAYDAGSEGNNEDCAYVPGPPCGSHVHTDDGAEGFVHVHAGIHGVADLVPAMHDWRGPVAAITIRPMH